MKKIILTGGFVLALAVSAVAQSHFTKGRLAVLRAGDGIYQLTLKQSPIFIDEFDPSVAGAGPTFTVAIPTNGANSFFFNGHAGSEGNLSRSSDHKFLAFAGYGGTDLLKVSGTASRLNIPRGFGSVDGGGDFHRFLYKSDMPEAKVNPRGAVTDGANHFWGCGNAYGTCYFDATGDGSLVRFKSFPNSRGINVIDNTLYVSMNAADSESGDQTAGIYTFTGLPREADATASLLIASAPQFKKIVAFDINPAGTVAYMSDIVGGVQKYTKSGSKWSFAYNFSIPQKIPADQNNSTGCFGLVVDFGGASPVIFATTTEGYNSCVNSNRIVRIIDTSAAAAVATIAQAGSTNVAFRGLAFTPE